MLNETDDPANPQTTPMLNTLLSKPNESAPMQQQPSPLPNGYPPMGSNSVCDSATAPTPPATGGQPSTSAPQLVAPQPLPPGMPHPGMHQHAPGMHGQQPHPMSGHPVFSGYPPGYYPHQMAARMPPGMQPPMYPPGAMHPGQFPPHHFAMMRGPQPGEMVKMPNGPTPVEWANAHKMKDGDDGNEPLRPPQWQAGPPPMPMHPGHPGIPPHMMPQPPAPNRKSNIVDQLVGPTTQANPLRVMPERRAFFLRLVEFCEQHGDPITMVPQVSKQNVDLHRLYIAVRNRGGFEQVTKDKAWKGICPEANPEIGESSAAGYQLRKHYQRHLLLLECLETGKNAEDAIAFADKLKKKRNKPSAAAAAASSSTDQASNSGAPGTPGSAATPAPDTPAKAGTPQPAATPTSSHLAPSPAPGAGAPGQPPAGYPPQGYPPPHAVPPGYYGEHGDGRVPPPGWPGYPPGMRMPPGAGPPPGAAPQIRPPPQHPQAGGDPLAAAAYASVPPGSDDPSKAQQNSLSQGPSTPHASQSQAPTPAPPATPGQPGTPASLTGVSLQVDSCSAAGSRAPSVGPPPAATPDSASRMSGGADDQQQLQRPPSQASHPQHAGTPGALQMTGPVGAPSPYYGQPHMYQRPGMPGAPAPGMRPPGAYPGYPPAGYPPMTQQQQHYMQQQYWQQRQAAAAAAGYPQPSPSAPNAAPPPVVAATPTAPPPTSNSAASPAPRYPAYPRMPAAATGPQGAPSPGGGQQQRVPTYPPPARGQPTPSQSNAPPAPAPPPQPPVPQLAPAVSFPPNSVEAAQITTRKRKRPTIKDVQGASSRRLIMSLRSGLATEATWALNSLSILLADDSAAPSATRLSDQPYLLGTLVEHLWAALNVLWPAEFPLDDPYRMKCRDTVALHDRCLVEESMLGEKSTVAKEIVGSGRRNSNNGEDKKKNYSKVTRTGRKVRFEKAVLPAELRRLICFPGSSDETPDDTLRPKFLDGRRTRGLAGGLAERVASNLRETFKAQRRLPKPAFSACRPGTSSEVQQDDDCCLVRTSSGTKLDDGPLLKAPKMEVDDENNESPFYFRRARPGEISTGPIDVEVDSARRTAIVDPDPALLTVAARCLCVSNLLRSLSFFPHNEMALATHSGLLFLCGRFLRLLADEKPFRRTAPLTKYDPDAPLPEVDSPAEQQRKAVALLDDDDESRCIFLETAAQLREDALIILCHISGSLLLYDLPDSISFPLLDGLIHWCTTSVPQATDPIADGEVCPRNYALEVLCKLSVIEANVDLTVSTGPWPRLERLALNLARQMNMNEEVQIREFGLVILNAVVAASPELAWVAAHETPAIEHLVVFIETADQNMHQVMQQSGMGALRDNPEMMGTSVGMLRRGASLLRALSKAPGAYRRFARHQHTLLKFTMSQLMDSRVAGMVADTLYTVQTALSAEEVERLRKVAEEEKQKKASLKEQEQTEAAGDREVKKEEAPEDVGSEGEKEADDKPMPKENGHASHENNTNSPLQTFDSMDTATNDTDAAMSEGSISGDRDHDDEASNNGLTKAASGLTTATKSVVKSTSASAKSANSDGPPRAMPNGIHPRENGGSMTAVA